MLARRKWPWMLQAAGAFLVLQAFASDALFLDRLRVLEANHRDQIILVDLKTFSGFFEEDEIAELDDIRHSVEVSLKETLEIRKNVSLVSGYLFIFGTIMTIFGFIAEKWKG